MSLALPVAGAVVVLALLRRRGQAAGNDDGPEGTASGAARNVDVDLPTQGEQLENVLAGGVSGGLAGSFAGPVGIIIGALVGSVIGATIDRDSFGNTLRTGVKKWLRDTGDSDQNGNCDAVLFRWMLLRLGTVWRNRQTGALGLRVLEVRNDKGAIAGRAVTMWRPQEFDANHDITMAADMLCEQATWGRFHFPNGRFDDDYDMGAHNTRHRAPFERFRKTAQVGDLHAFVLSPDGGPVDQGDVLGLRGIVAYYVRTRVRMDLNLSAGTWDEIDVTAENVDALAQWFDRKVRATWKDTP